MTKYNSCEIPVVCDCVRSDMNLNLFQRKRNERKKNYWQIAYQPNICIVNLIHRLINLRKEEEKQPKPLHQDIVEVLLHRFFFISAFALKPMQTCTRQDYKTTKTRYLQKCLSALLSNNNTHTETHLHALEYIHTHIHTMTATIERRI